MNARELIEETFLAPFAQKNRCFTGVELEFPLLNLSGADAPDLVSGLLEHLLANGFTTDETDIHGNSVFLMNADGDCLSFDNDYNNFEFAMEKDRSLTAMADRFYKLYELVQTYLLPKGHTLAGLGTNPHHGRAAAQPVAYPIYQVLRRFLSGFSGGKFHCFPDFPAWLSSVQTHLDVPLEQLPRALTLFAALDFVHGLLFSNSLPFADVKGFERTLCFRDYLWEHSGFGSLADNTGPVCGRFDTPADITAAFLKKSIFLTAEGDKYQMIPAVNLGDYLDKVGTQEALGGYLSFKNVEITRRGTLEIRSDCAQPVAAAFAPPAFHLGIFHGLEEAENLLNGFWEHLPKALVQAPDRNARLRRAVIYGEELPVAEAPLRCLLADLLQLAADKLKQRGLGEERLLAPLYRRAETLTCPALKTRRRLERGEDWLAIIRDYADPLRQI